MKRVTIDAFFPELPASHAYYAVEGRGSSLTIALKRGVEALFHTKGVARRKLTGFRLTVSVAEETREIGQSPHAG